MMANRSNPLLRLGTRERPLSAHCRRPRCHSRGRLSDRKPALQARRRAIPSRPRCRHSRSAPRLAAVGGKLTFESDFSAMRTRMARHRTVFSHGGDEAGVGTGALRQFRELPDVRVSSGPNLQGTNIRFPLLLAICSFRSRVDLFGSLKGMRQVATKRCSFRSFGLGPLWMPVLRHVSSKSP